MTSHRRRAYFVVTLGVMTLFGLVSCASLGQSEGNKIQFAEFVGQQKLWSIKEASFKVPNVGGVDIYQSGDYPARLYVIIGKLHGARIGAWEDVEKSIAQAVKDVGGEGFIYGKRGSEIVGGRNVVGFNGTVIAYLSPAVQESEEFQSLLSLQFWIWQHPKGGKILNTELSEEMVAEFQRTKLDSQLDTLLRKCVPIVQKK